MGKSKLDSLRVALVYGLDLRSHRQIFERTVAQARGLMEAGILPTVVCWDRGTPGEFPDDFRPLKVTGSGLVRSMREQRALQRRLEQVDPEIAIVRYGFASYALLKLAKRYPVVLEIHSDDTRELPQRLHHRLYVRISSALFRKRLMQTVKGAVFVSSDIASLSVFDDIVGPRKVVSNGIRVPPKPVPAPLHEKPVVGYSVGYAAPWQGIDRLVSLADELPEIEFRLIVPNESIAREAIGSRVNVLIAEDTGKYNAYIADFDVALGGLALDRKGISRAAALKVRESVSLGIPTLLFSIDEDLDDVSTETVATLACGAWEPTALAPFVSEFIQGALGLRVPDEIRYRVDISSKIGHYVTLIEEVVSQSSD